MKPKSNRGLVTIGLILSSLFRRRDSLRAAGSERVSMSPFCVRRLVSELMLVSPGNLVGENDRDAANGPGCLGDGKPLKRYIVPSKTADRHCSDL